MRIIGTASFRLTHIVAMLVLFMLSNYVTLAQSTAFTYQGKLTDAGNPANGTYDLQFRLPLVNGQAVVRHLMPAPLVIRLFEHTFSSRSQLSHSLLV